MSCSNAAVPFWPWSIPNLSFNLGIVLEYYFLGKEFNSDSRWYSSEYIFVIALKDIGFAYSHFTRQNNCELEKINYFYRRSHSHLLSRSFFKNINLIA